MVDEFLAYQGKKGVIVKKKKTRQHVLSFDRMWESFTAAPTLTLCQLFFLLFPLLSVLLFPIFQSGNNVTHASLYTIGPCHRSLSLPSAFSLSHAAQKEKISVEEVYVNTPPYYKTVKKKKIEVCVTAEGAHLSL